MPALHFHRDSSDKAFFSPINSRAILNTVFTDNLPATTTAQAGSLNQPAVIIDKMARIGPESVQMDLEGRGRQGL